MARALSNGIAMLARFLPTMLRAMASGRVSAVVVSAMLTIQAGPSASRLAMRGRASLIRTIAALKQYFPHAVVIVGLKCRQIDLRGAVEYEPERIGTMEDRGGRRRSERQFEPQPVTRLLRPSDHDCIRVGLRPNGVIGGSQGWGHDLPRGWRSGRRGGRQLRWRGLRSGVSSVRSWRRGGSKFSSGLNLRCGRGDGRLGYHGRRL